jgi:hypothetical protein
MWGRGPSARCFRQRPKLPLHCDRRPGRKDPVPVDKQSVLVRADCNPEAELFVATSDDVPGLVPEGPTPKTLPAKLEVLIPELLAVNAPRPAAP